MSEEQEYLEPSGEETPPVAVETEESVPSEQDAGAEPVETQPEPKKSGVQERIDELVRQREEARRDAEYWRNMAPKPPVQPVQVQPEVFSDLPEPSLDAFDTFEDWTKAHNRWSAKTELKRFQAEQKMASEGERKASWLQTGMGKYNDFRDVVHENLPISNDMVNVLLDSDKGHELAYYLGKNPGEAARIFNLPAHRQAYEMGKIEAKLAGPTQKTKTNAPVPTSPVGGKEIPAKKPEDMDHDEYKAWRAAGGGK